MGSDGIDIANGVPVGDLPHLDRDVNAISSHAIPDLATNPLRIRRRRHTLPPSGEEIFRLVVSRPELDAS